MPNSCTIAATLRAPVAAVRAAEVEHVSAILAAILCAPVAAISATEVEHITGATAATLRAPYVSAMAAEVEHVSAIFVATLRAPRAAMEATEIGHGQVAMGCVLRAPRAVVLSGSVPPEWRVMSKSMKAAPRLYSAHQRYSKLPRARHGSQRQAFLWHASHRANKSCADLYYQLTTLTADQITDAAKTERDVS